MFKRSREKSRALWDAVSSDEIGSFVGLNGDRFRRTENRMRINAYQRPKFFITWCWGAFLFGYAWFAYRKMYGLAAFIFLVPLILMLAFGLDGATYAGALGVLGKPAYIWHALRQSAKMKARGVADDAALAAAGGVSRVAGAIAGIPLLITFGLVLWGVVRTFQT